MLYTIILFLTYVNQLLTLHTILINQTLTDTFNAEDILGDECGCSDGKAEDKVLSFGQTNSVLLALDRSVYKKIKPIVCVISW